MDVKGRDIQRPNQMLSFRLGYADFTAFSLTWIGAILQLYTERNTVESRVNDG